ncbi:MAG: HAD family phosphatase [Chitinophagaceae bacterium]|nr:MAG: HAD family phosphatase [Chitinophagaceae bacterium]
MIKNIIFDYGEVIVNVDPDKTIKALEALADKETLTQGVSLNQTFFHEFERGQITAADFRSNLKALLNCKSTDEELDDAWNAMLEDLPEENLQMLTDVKTKYRSFLLSNTNELHLASLEKYLLKTYNFPDLAGFLEKEYYSHLIGMRKPDMEIFNFVLTENKLSAAETLFLDDNPANIEAAKKLGIHTEQVSKSRPAILILKEMNLIS